MAGALRARPEGPLPGPSSGSVRVILARDLTDELLRVDSHRATVGTATAVAPFVTTTTFTAVREADCVDAFVEVIFTLPEIDVPSTRPVVFNKTFKVSVAPPARVPTSTGGHVGPGRGAGRPGIGHAGEVIGQGPLAMDRHRALSPVTVHSRGVGDLDRPTGVEGSSYLGLKRRHRRGHLEARGGTRSDHVGRVQVGDPEGGVQSTDSGVGTPEIR